MGISKKHRRKIVVAGREFLWSVRRDPKWEYRQPVGSAEERVLSVVTSDRRFVVELPFDRLRSGLPDHALVLSGPEIDAREATEARYRHVELPRELVPDDGSVTPRFVRAVVDWVLSQTPQKRKR
ncbi:MAG TPA: hypothetical protein VFF73_21965 [Planctomycetota bacterium]|nr:hypothetical protein [Planctomycetota bacterium]